MKDGMDALAISTIMAGVVLILFGLFRLGSLIKFMPHTITVGFTAGIAVTILIGQLKDFLSLVYSGGEKAVSTMDKLALFFKYISSFNPYSLVLGACCLVIIFLWPKLSGICARIPSSFIAVAFTVIFDLIVGITVALAFHIIVVFVGKVVIKDGLNNL